MVLPLGLRINAKSNPSSIPCDNLHLDFIDEVREVHGPGETLFQTMSIDVIGPIDELAITGAQTGITYFPAVSSAVVL